MRYTSDTTPSTAHVSRAGLDPSDFGAVAAVTWMATVAATNDRAFADATAAALAQKKNLTVSPGIYPINRWIIDAPGTNNLEIRAYGATLLASNQLTDGVAPGDALMEVKSSIGKPNGEDFARRISIFGLNVMSGVGIHAPRVQRAGIRLFAVQDIVFRDVWVSGFYYSGLTLDTVYDSTFESVSLVEVGSSAPTG